MKSVLIEYRKFGMAVLAVFALKGVYAALVLVSRLEKSLMRYLASCKEKLALHRFIRLRQRYILTKSNKLRMRYVVACGSFAAVALMSALSITVSSYGVLGDGDSRIAAFTGSAAQDATSLAMLEPASGLSDPRLSEILQNGISSGIRKASTAIQKPEKPRYREIELGKGDTVAGLLQNAGLSDSDTYYAVRAIGKYLDVRKIKSGQKIDLHFRPGGNTGSLELARMDMKIDPVRQLRLTRKGPEAFDAEIEEKELVPRVHARKAKIKTSLYGSAARASIPSSIVAEVIRVYSWNIDFQRDIQPGDSIEVLYETLETEDGDYARNGDILYASLSVGGKKIPIYRYETEDGHADFFAPDGSSIRKTLMKTPVDGARISSGFGMRRHPVLGYSKMHKGMDFAAPTGTPIYAAGDGTVEYAGRFSSYGNYVRIRHNNKLKTAYAHMHKIRSGVSVGSRVKQGQIIGYVGTTGRSTGPHLHYETLVNNVAVNPKGIGLPTGQQLGGKELKRFKSMVGAIRQQYVSLFQGGKLADNSDTDRNRNKDRISIQ